MAAIIWILAGVFAAGILAALLCFLHACHLYRKWPIPALLQLRSTQPDYVPLEQICPCLPEIAIMQEDVFFYTHRGYHLYGIYDALRQNLKAGKIVRGGSTITQQLVKNLYFPFKKTYRRKALELFLALQAERVLTKDQIMELYLNTVNFGCAQWGIGNAAAYYFNRTPSQLSDAQCLMLAAILPAPDVYNPLHSQELWQNVREKALTQMQILNIPPERIGSLREASLELADRTPRPAERICSNPLAESLRNQLHQGRGHHAPSSTE